MEAGCLGRPPRTSALYEVSFVRVSKVSLSRSGAYGATEVTERSEGTEGVKYAEEPHAGYVR